MEDSTAQLVQLARRAAQEAGDLLQERFGGPAAGVSTKSSSTDLVSDADREAERAIVERIRQDRPSDAILGEEGGSQQGGREGGGLRWVIDPLDGTTNYLWGIPHWCVSIAVEDARGALVGVVHDPCRGETYWAVRGGGAHCGDQALRLADAPTPQLDHALIATGFNYDRDHRRQQGEQVAAVLAQVRDIRRCGAAALDLAWLAAGRLDGYYESGLGHWDWAAGALIVAEAGGRVAEVGQRPRRLVAARSALFDPLVDLLG